MIAPTLRRSSLRYLARHPWLLGLSLLGIALGVAVVVAVDLASESARRAFRLSAETLTGSATHRVVAGPQGVSETLYAELRLAGFRPSAPLLDGYLRLPGRTLQLIGVDPLAEAPFRRPAALPAGGEALQRLLTRPGSVLLAAGTAAELGLAPGAGFRAEIGGRPRELVLAGVLDPADSAQARVLEGLAVADLATAQELLGRHGRLSRIELIAPQQGGEAWLARLRAQLPPGVSLEAVGGEVAFMAEVTRAFSVNLTALSLLALLVGGFLVYNTMSFAVVQRLPLLGILRGLGASRGELFWLVLLEGLLLGVALGGGLVKLVTRTVDELYFTLTVGGLFLAPLSLAKGIVLGLVATCLAALQPAWMAMRAAPGQLLHRSWIESRARRAARLAAVAGLLLCLLAGLLLAASGGLLAGFAALFALLLGAALVVPQALLWLARGLARLPLGRGDPVTRLALRSLDGALSRTGVAAAALTVAVAATIGIAGMIDSFRGTVDRWLGQRLQADVYVSSPGQLDRDSSVPLAPELVAALQRLGGVRALSSYRGVSVPAPGGPVRLAVVELSAAGRSGHALKQGDAATAWAAFERGAVLLSEPFAHRSGLQRGAQLTLLTPAGSRDFPVAGVYYDYGSGGGHVLMASRTYRSLWHDAAVSSVGLYAAPGADHARLLAAVRGAVADGPPLLVRSNRELRAASLEVFDRTFRITEVLRLLAIAVAFVGVLSACLTLQLERAREFAMLRALGLLPGQLRRLVVQQTALLGAASGLLALPLGWLLAGLLTVVINQRAFGWTLELEPSLAPSLEALALALGAALLAGLLVALRAAVPPAAALRLE